MFFPSIGKDYRDRLRVRRMADRAPVSELPGWKHEPFPRPAEQGRRNGHMVRYDAESVQALIGKAVRAPQGRKGYLTFYDPGLSIVDLRDRLQKKKVFAPDQSWVECHPFSKVRTPPQWRQLRLTPLDCMGETFAEQVKHLPHGEEVPPARVIVMGMVLHFLATGDWLFSHCFVGTAEMVGPPGPSRRRFTVGHFRGLMFYDHFDGNHYDDLRLTSVRKF